MLNLKKNREEKQKHNPNTPPLPIAKVQGLENSVSEKKCNIEVDAQEPSDTFYQVYTPILPISLVTMPLHVAWASGFWEVIHPQALRNVIDLWEPWHHDVL